MKLLANRYAPRSCSAQEGASLPQRGAALLLALMVLIVILMITYQITRTTGTDQIETNRTLVFSTMDYAIESAFQQVEEDLLADAEAGGAGAEGGDDPGAGGGLGGEGGDDAGGEGGATDSQMDPWATPAATTIGERELRILIEDEDRKFNILGMLSDDEEIAQEAFDITVRILDACREGTRADIDGGDADAMARAIRDHLLQRDETLLPTPVLLSSGDPDSIDNDRPVLPMSLAEFAVLEPFEEFHFQDLFDEDGERVHSIGAFLTIYTSAVIGGGAPDEGWKVNVNTAPLAVLSSLFDSSVVNDRIWDAIVLYRNQEEEPDPEAEVTEPALDEFGNELFEKQIFDDLEELEEVYEFNSLNEDTKAEILERLKVSSQVFTATITARQTTATEDQVPDIRSRRDREEYERSGTFLVRTVRRVYLRSSGEDSSSMIPLVNWEVLSYAPMEILDFPEADY